MVKEVVYGCGCVVSKVKHKDRCVIHRKGIIAISGSATQTESFPVTKVSDRLWTSNTEDLPFKSIAKSFDVVFGRPSLCIPVTSPFFGKTCLRDMKVAYIGARNLVVVSRMLEQCSRAYIDSQFNLVARLIADPGLIYSLGLRKRK